MKAASREGSAQGHRTRVLVIDGSRVFGELLVSALDGEQDLECAGLAQDVVTGVAEAIRLRPDVTLAIDLHLGGEDRASVAPAVAAAWPSGRVVLLTSALTGRRLDHDRRPGGSVVLGEHADLAMVLAAVRQGDGVGTSPAEAAPGTDDTDSPDIGAATLAPADLRLLRLVAAGYDSESAARELRTSPDTVRRRLRRICADLEADTPTEAVAVAVAAGVLRLGPDA